MEIGYYVYVIVSIHKFINYKMRVQLSRDPLFLKKQSPVKELKEKQRQRIKQIKSLRVNPSNQKPQSNIEIIDPLPQQLQKYKNQIEYKKTFESSKASHRLKKYIIQQERNLKCIRLERLTDSPSLQSSRVHRSQLKVDMATKRKSKQEQQKLDRQINIPRIQQIFKNQQKQYVLYQSRMMRNQLSKAIQVIDNGVTKLKAYSLTGAHNPAQQSKHDTRKNTLTDKFPQININNSSHVNQEDLEIDKIIEKKLNMSQKLRDRLYRQKKQIMTNQAKDSSQSKSLNFFLSIPKKPKKKVMLQGVKSITFCEGQKVYKVTPASSLLFSLNKMSIGRDKKQEELQGLIQNSYQNRQSILSQKSNFYEQQSPFNNLNPSNQFKLRQLMDKKLMHRLELSKDQITKFVAYLFQIKEYHVIINDTVLNILKEVRETLLSGKVMKMSDLIHILETKQKQQLKGHPNQLIIQKLSDMMI